MSEKIAGPPQSTSDEIKAWRQDADKGDSIAQCHLGYAYWRGNGVPKDYAQAVTFFRSSAAQGDAAAQFGLAMAYILGQGVPEDCLEAYKYFCLSAAQGIEQAANFRDKLAQKLKRAQVARGRHSVIATGSPSSNRTNTNRNSESGRSAIPSEIRREIWRRDQGKCVKCGSRKKLEYDHIIPVSKGGSNTARNIELLCEACNRAKSDLIQ